MLATNNPPRRITGDASEIGAPARNAAYIQNVTVANITPTPVANTTPLVVISAAATFFRSISHQITPAANGTDPYNNIPILFGNLPDAAFTNTSAAANATAAPTAYIIQLISLLLLLLILILIS